MTTPAITAETTREQAVSAYKDNLTYDLDESLVSARQFIAAGRWLLANPVSRVSGGRDFEEVELRPDIVQDQVNKAVTWYRANKSRLSGGSDVRYADMSYRE